MTKSLCKAGRGCFHPRSPVKNVMSIVDKALRAFKLASSFRPLLHPFHLCVLVLALLQHKGVVAKERNNARSANLLYSRNVPFSCTWRNRFLPRCAIMDGSLQVRCCWRRYRLGQNSWHLEEIRDSVLGIPSPDIQFVNLFLRRKHKIVPN